MKVGLSGGACSRDPTFPLRTPSGSVSFSGNISPQPNGILKFLLARNREFESVSLQRGVKAGSVVELLEVVDATTMPMQSRGRDGEKLGKSELVHL